MRTRDDVFTEVLVRNNRSTTDGFITDTNLKNWYKNAHNVAAARHKWPFTEGKASTTYTTSNIDDLGNTVVAYPEGWKADSVRIITIGGKRIKKTEFESFLRFLEENSGNTARMFSDYGRQLYVNVNADVSGTLVAFGQYMPIIDVTDETGITVFSDYDEEGNEAIYELMTSRLKEKEHLSDEVVEHQKKAGEILDEIWKRVQDEQYKYPTKDQSMFEPFDVLRGESGFNQYKRNQF